IPFRLGPLRAAGPATQWLVSALAYHYGLDRGVENEIVVLATGLDQYLQEIFHHLDCDGSGRIPGEDFRTLCQVLGLEEAAEPEEASTRLCGHFSTRPGPRLPLGRESEHIETQIRLRSPPGRRRRDPARALEPRAQAEDRIARLEEENGSLRELVEDMRAPLQSSVLRCLALQVTIRFSQELEKELKSSQEALVSLEDCNRNLKREQAEMRRKVEEARHAVQNSLGKVKELEVRAKEVPHLQVHIQQLESQLQHYR
uniref:Uncharacterized protein n=1 Tax=Geospiza parvula TaxID=87175 RepID=A0A8U8AQN8_GEOPR